jgi:hypothetical protein
VFLDRDLWNVKPPFDVPPFQAFHAFEKRRQKVGSTHETSLEALEMLAPILEELTSDSGTTLERPILTPSVNAPIDDSLGTSLAENCPPPARAVRPAARHDYVQTPTSQQFGLMIGMHVVRCICISGIQFTRNELKQFKVNVWGRGMNC